MDFIGFCHISSKKARRILEISLLAAGLIYFLAIFIMDKISPVPLLLYWVFAILLALGWTLVHFFSRLNVLLALAAISMIGAPFSIVMHNLFEGLAGRVGDLPLLQQVCQVLHGVFFILGLMVFPPAFLMGIIGGAILYFISRYRNYQDSQYNQ
jgi:hypothetical protein